MRPWNGFIRTFIEEKRGFYALSKTLNRVPPQKTRGELLAVQAMEDDDKENSFST